MGRKKWAWLGLAVFLILAVLCIKTPWASVIFLLGCVLLFPLDRWQIFLEEKLELLDDLKLGGAVILLVLGIVLTQTTKPVEVAAEVTTPSPTITESAEDALGSEETQESVTQPPEATEEPSVEPSPELSEEPSPEPTSSPGPTPEPTPESSEEPTTEPQPTPASEPVSEPGAEEPVAVEPVQMDYVLNTNTKKFHLPSCSSVTQMKDKNRQYFTGTRDELIGRGYSPCGKCKP